MILGMKRQCRIFEGPNREIIEGLIERIQGHIETIDFAVHYNPQGYPSRYAALVVWWTDTEE